VWAKSWVCHDINIVQDSFGGLEKVYSICLCLPHSLAWKANVGIWIVEGVVFVLKGQEHSIEKLINY
jgi:hypothetical protein